MNRLTYDWDVAGVDGSITVPLPRENPLQGKAIYLFAPVPSGALEPLVTVDTVMALFFSGIRGLRNRAREAVQLFAGNHAKSLKRKSHLSFRCADPSFAGSQSARRKRVSRDACGPFFLIGG